MTNSESSLTVLLLHLVGSPSWLFSESKTGRPSLRHCDCVMTRLSILILLYWVKVFRLVRMQRKRMLTYSLFFFSSLALQAHVLLLYIILSHIEDDTESNQASEISYDATTGTRQPSRLFSESLSYGLIRIFLF